METGQLNIYQKTIEILIEEGHAILQIFNLDGTAFYFTVMEFKESFRSASSSVEFNSLKGINITDFLRINGSQPDKTNLLSRFRDIVNNSPIIRVEFSDNVRWFKWASASR